MYCPQCGVEYREGFTECSDCKVPLLAGPLPPEPETPDPFDPSLGTVVVLESRNAIQLALAKGLLDDSGIPYILLGKITTLVNDVDPFLQKPVRILAPSDREAEAREVLESLLNPDASLAAVEDAPGDSGNP
jgi:Putative prokaryotic signal transducing protein